jgi:hypothetical protein
LSFARWFSLVIDAKEVGVSRSVGRAIGLDVHRDFCEVAICERGRARSVGRIDTTRDALELFASAKGQTREESNKTAMLEAGYWQATRESNDPATHRRPRPWTLSICWS